MKFKRSFIEPDRGSVKEVRKFAFWPVKTSTHYVWLQLYSELQIWCVEPVFMEKGNIMALKKYWNVVERKL